MPPFRPIIRRENSAAEKPWIRVPTGPYQNWALLLDLDGTLIDLAGRPRHAEIPADLPQLLLELHASLGGALALFTGRSLEDADRLMAMPELPIVAEYGAVIRVKERIIRHVHGGEQCLDSVLSAIRPELQACAGVDLDIKSHGFVLTFEQEPALDDPLHQRLVRALAPFGHVLRLIHARNVVEVRCAGINYGNAVERLWSELRWHERVPVFVGDDLPDLAGFAAARRLCGYAIAVGKRLEANEYILPNPSQLRAWLDYIAVGLKFEARNERDRRSAFLGMPPLNLRQARPRHWHGLALDWESYTNRTPG